jgi:hypothetical protein
MTKPQTRHAERVVGHFRESVSESARKYIGERHFEELVLMIESAIDAAVLEELANHVQQLERVVAHMKHSAERFDIDSTTPAVNQ